MPTDISQYILDIYRMVANKSITFGCKVFDNVNGIGGRIISVHNDEWNTLIKFLGDDGVSIMEANKEDLSIIGHPVMIGDILEYIENASIFGNETLNFQTNTLLNFWLHKETPIDKQWEAVVKHIHMIIFD